MTHLMNLVKTGGRAAIIALTLGASTLAVVPAAQAQPSFNFQFGVGPDGKPSVGFGVDTDGRRGPGYRPGPRPQVCYSEREIIRGIRAEGYRDVEIVRELPRNRVGVIARDGRNWYSMRVDKCTGEVDRVQRLRNYRPGMRFQFNF